jgi:predicted TIM-barrel fold metal-dependent hydrolase
MYTAPSLSPCDLEHLVRICGGLKPAAKALGVTPARLNRWLQLQAAPPWVLKLLWYCSPDGHAAAQIDMHNELRLVAAERNALVCEATRRAKLLEQSVAAMQSKIEALEQENLQLKRLLGTRELRPLIERARAQLDTVLSHLGSPRREPSSKESLYAENGTSASNGRLPDSSTVGPTLNKGSWARRSA